MLSFDVKSGQCFYRVAGVAVHDNHVLLQRDLDGVWFAPGKNVAPQESARNALKQAISATLGAEVHIGRLLWVHERIIDGIGEPSYEMTFYFEMSFPKALLCFPRNTPITWIDKGSTMTFQWIPLQKLDAQSIHPACFQQQLHEFAEEIRAISHDTSGFSTLLYEAEGLQAREVGV
jgi:hypothetical protein